MSSSLQLSPFILFLYVLLYGSISHCQESDFFLIPTVELASLDPYEVDLINQAANQYNQAETDTQRIWAVQLIINDSYDNRVWIAYNRWLFNFLERLLINEKNASMRSIYLQSMAGCYNNFGYEYDMYGQLDSAISAYQKSYDLCLITKDTLGMATLANNMGYLYLGLGQLDKAKQLYYRALQLNGFIDNPSGVYDNFSNLAVLYKQSGDIDSSMNCYEKAAAVAEQIGDKVLIIESIEKRAFNLLQFGKLEQALALFDTILQTFDEIPNPNVKALTLSNLASTYASIGQYDLALRLAKRADTLFVEQKDEIQVLQNLLMMARLHVDLKEYRMADTIIQSVFIRYQKLENIRGLCNAWMQLGHLYELTDRKDDVIDAYRYSFKYASENNDQLKMAKLSALIGLIFIQNNELDSARYYSKVGLEKAQNLNIADLLEDHYLLKYHVLKKDRKFDDALMYFELHSELKDSLNNKNLLKKATQRQASYVFKQKREQEKLEQEAKLKQEREAQRRRDEIQYSLIFLGILGLFF